MRHPECVYVIATHRANLWRQRRSRFTNWRYFSNNHWEITRCDRAICLKRNLKKTGEKLDGQIERSRHCWCRKKENFVETVLMTSSIACGQMLSGLAQAQSADSGERQSQDLQEIVVTAQKPASTVQTTLIAITAIDSYQIQRQGLTDFRGLSAQVPGVSAGKSGNGRSDFVIRGLSDVGGTSPTRARPFDCDRHSPAQPRRDRTT